MKRYILTIFLVLSCLVAIKAQTTNENETLIPDVAETSLRRGYAYEVGLMKYVLAPTSDNQRMHRLFFTDTLTINFKLANFHFNAALGVSMPQTDCAVKFTLYNVSDGWRHEVLRSPFRVDGSTMHTYISPRYERQDSVVLRLAPGRYLLEYDGYNESIEFDPLLGVGESNPVDNDGLVMGNSAFSGIKLVLECLPLITDPVTVVSSYNHVVNKVRRALPEPHPHLKDRGLITTTTWFDDFGREISTHQVGATPQHKTLVDYKLYDAAGRQTREWLGTSMSISGSDQYVALPSVRQSAVFQHADNAPYSKAIYENSVLDRKIKEFGPGAAWRTADRAVTNEYLSNNNTEDRLKCQQIVVSSSDKYDTTMVIRSQGLFPSGSLKVISVTDEDGRETLSFTDKLGRTILQRQVLGSAGADEQFLDTYYIYDDFDHLVAVVPPALSSEVTGVGTPCVEVDRYAYLYIYDEWERIVGKKLPGCSWVRMVYDKADRLIFSQDGRQRAQGKSTFHLYDVYGRECVSGLCNKNVTIGESVDSFVRADYGGNGNSLLAYDYFGVSLYSPKIMTVTFYDSYNFLDEFTTGLPNISAMYGESVPSNISRVTGSVQYPLSLGVGTSGEVWSLARYDNRGRTSHVETSYRSNGGHVVEDIEYDFMGNPVRRHIEHKYSSTSSPVTELYTYSYDHAERLIEVKHRLNGGQNVLLARNSYDEFGRLSSTERGESSSLTTQYSYNVRSWLTSLSSPLFEERLRYNAVRNGSLLGSNGMFGGAASSISYKYSGDHQMKSYDYGYDGLGRLSQARYSDGVAVGGYDVDYMYDYMGNIVAMSREEDGMSALLLFSYDGNRLMSPFGIEGEEYEYDGNGNMTYDPTKGVVVSYNVNNQPARIFNRSHILGSLDLEYIPDGTLLSRDVVLNRRQHSLTEYRGNAVYQDNAPKYLLFDGGLIDMAGNTPDYQFFIKDHLGSTRVVATAFGQVLQSNEYYPYGETIEHSLSNNNPGDDIPVIDGPIGDRFDWPVREPVDTLFDFEIDLPVDNEISLAQSRQPYKFSGKEFMTSHGINLYDFGARYYDPALCRFTTMDPLAEKYYSTSPYAYCNNNPVIFVDRTGKFFDIAWDAANVAMDATSLAANATSGNIPGAIVDAVGLAVDVAAAVVPGVPGGAGTAIKAARSAEKVSNVGETALQAFKVAGEFGVDTYKNLRKAVLEKYGKGSGLEVHHLIEKRFKDILNVKANEMPAMVLTKDEHRVFTNKWRDKIGYGNKKDVQMDDILNAASEIYDGNKDILKSIDF